MKVTVQRRSSSAALIKRAQGAGRVAAYVGVPAATSRERSAQLLKMAGVRSSERAAKLRKAAAQDINNAELLFLFTNGSPLRRQPPRPVLQPAVEAAGNRERIARELTEKVRAQLAGDSDAALRHTQRAAMAGQNAARAWFTDPRKNWAPNAPSTIHRKGSSRTGIDTGAMRASIVGITGEE